MGRLPVLGAGGNADGQVSNDNNDHNDDDANEWEKHVRHSDRRDKSYPQSWRQRSENLLGRHKRDPDLT